MGKYHLDKIEPLYTKEEAEDSLSYFDGYPYEHPVTIGNNMTCTFYDAGHILGSAITLIQASENGKPYTIGYTGDLGRFDKPILNDPTLRFNGGNPEIDLLIMESTYGDRFHDPVQDIKSRLKQILMDTADRGGSIVIPAFAFGRTQELIYVLHKLYDEGEVIRLPIYVDSPLAVKLTRIFGEHPEVYDQETHETFLEKGKNPFSFGHIQFITTVEESMACARPDAFSII
jgi:metallo-beta-lactamase family protein